MIPDAKENYGLSKELGEVSGKFSCTFRTTIIGQELTSKASLVKWLISCNGKTIYGFKNTIFSGLPTMTLSRLIHDKLMKSNIYGNLLNISSDPISKYYLLVRLRDEFNLNIMIKADTRYIINRSLSNQKLSQITSYKSPEWSELVDELHDSWLHSN
jgi:dTDP-4-dehydrorhamnose reductase